MSSDLEIENLHLKEALSFAKTGWEDALILLRKERESPTGEVGVLEIKSLEMELQTLHKSVLARHEMMNTFKENLNTLSSQCVERIDEIATYMNCPVNSMIKKEKEGEIEKEELLHEDEADILDSYLKTIENGTQHKLELLCEWMKKSKEEQKAESHHHKPTHKAKDKDHHGKKSHKPTIIKKITK